MKKLINNHGSSDSGCIAIIAAFTFYVIICSILGSILWPYTINTWLDYAGKPDHITAWQGALLGLVPGIGQAMVPAAFFTFVVMLFL